ncbi:hypothetical protein BDF19DRAFT_441210 [Syncephalis fuscata]|nr:hypothetical protein BDF19DRAFT_441210 [Syncephalis fuscata]
MVSFRIVLIALACSAIGAAALPQNTFTDGSAWSADKSTNPGGSIETGADAPPRTPPSSLGDAQSSSTPVTSAPAAAPTSGTNSPAAPATPSTSTQAPATNNNNQANANANTNANANGNGSSNTATNPTSTSSSSTSPSSTGSSTSTPSSSTTDTPASGDSTSSAGPIYVQQPALGMAAAFAVTYAVQALL